jgi:hypothetical protein
MDRQVQCFFVSDKCFITESSDVHAEYQLCGLFRCIRGPSLAYRDCSSF